ncbi:MAG: metallophosphoesterase [Deltaproteobacteria bacterium]|nr:metallophosphoesterase [Deltaproteobacteria bacterium]
MGSCFFASDLHGRVERWEKLFDAVGREAPAAVFLGGDLLPSGLGYVPPADGDSDFLGGFLASGLRLLRGRLGASYPRVFAILGNDDPRTEEDAVLALEREGLWTYLHGRKDALGDHPVYGYACVPPTPFALKDWERYDLSRFVDPGAVSPEEGIRSVPVPESETRWGTIALDLQALAGGDDLSRAILLFHSPPHHTALDRAALDGTAVDHAPLDPHVGSIAIRKFLAARQPLLSLHGHVHESARLTGAWRDRIGRTHLFGAAHDGPELALVRFDADDPEHASRELL